MVTSQPQAVDITHHSKAHGEIEVLRDIRIRDIENFPTYAQGQ